MSGTNTIDVEHRAFRRDLDAFLNADAAAERRAALIEEEAQHLIQPGQEFYPWMFEHFEEAIGNAPNGDLKAIFASIAAAVDLQLNNQYSNHLALTALQQAVESYWLDCARKKAREI